MTRKILVVEDDRMSRTMLTKRLTKSGFQVVPAVDAEQAIAAIPIEHPDLILMDVGLPGMNGYDATRQLKADPSTRQIPVIILTGLDTEADREEAFAAGCDDFAHKPVEMRLLLEKMQVLMP